MLAEQETSNNNNVHATLTNEKSATNTKNILYSNIDIIAVDGNDGTAYLEGRAQAYMNRDNEKADNDTFFIDNKELALGLRHARGKVKAKVTN